MGIYLNLNTEKYNGVIQDVILHMWISHLSLNFGFMHIEMLCCEIDLWYVLKAR